jgi:co-chaperonin GroES (HSP10)
MKLVYKPIGARLLVDPIITTVSLEKRAEIAGLYIVLEEDNVPKPTQGRVVALGSDPLLQEEIRVGDVAFFHWAAGHEVNLEGRTFRQLELSEVTGVMTPSEEKAASEAQEQHLEPARQS